MGDLKGAPAVHCNFPLLSFSRYTTLKLGLPLHVSLFLWNRGGLVNGYTWKRFNITLRFRIQIVKLPLDGLLHFYTPPTQGILSNSATVCRTI